MSRDAGTVSGVTATILYGLQERFPEGFAGARFFHNQSVLIRGLKMEQVVSPV